MVIAHEKRAFPRKLLHGAGEISHALSESGMSVNMLDISARGIAFLSPSPLPDGSIWIVRFLFGLKRISVIIRIAYCIKHSLVDTYRVGAEFRELDGRQTTAIRIYLKQTT